MQAYEKLQGLLADEIHKVAYSSRQSSEISSLLTTKSSMKEENRGTIKGMRLLGKIWPLDGFKVTRDGEKSTEVSRSRRISEGYIHR